jgi:hypothetical protein
MDVLGSNYSVTPLGIVKLWLPAFGQLRFEGAGTPQVYSAILQSVYYFSTSAKSTQRVLTWTTGAGANYNPSNGHVYRYYEIARDFNSARQWCAEQTFSGVPGYLATITSADENRFITAQMAPSGWLGGAQDGTGLWKWIDGPEANTNAAPFWQGGAPNAGGHGIAGAFTNWDNNSIVAQPTNSPGENKMRISMQGQWFDVTGSAATNGFVCEFGGSGKITATGRFGSVVVEPAGCLTNTEIICQALGTQQCSSTECYVDTTTAIHKCSPSCAFRTADSCTMDSRCTLSPTTTPASCVIDTCGPLNPTDCDNSAECRMDGNKCIFKNGCELWTTVNVCNDDSRCTWTTKCIPKPCARYNDANMQCLDNQCQVNCLSDNLCYLDAKANQCVDVPCVQADACDTANAQCAKKNSVTPGAFSYSRGTSPVKLFPTANLTGSLITGLTVMIVSGFQSGDILTLSGPGIGSTYDDVNGILRVSAADDWNLAINNVAFATTSELNVDRQITYAVDFSNVRTVYLPGINGVVSVAAAISVSYSEAFTTCTSTSPAGALVAIPTGDVQTAVARLLLGKNYAWLAGTGNTIPGGQTLWKWNSFTTNNMFFVGDKSVSNTNDQYTRWAANEPSGAGNLMMFPDGTWTAQKASSPLSTVALCLRPTSAVQSQWNPNTGVATVSLTGCFPTLCGGLSTKQTCQGNPRCSWDGTTCTVSACDANTGNKAACMASPNCYYNSDKGLCLVNPTGCAVFTQQSQCAEPCQWGNGQCSATGCNKYPDATTCMSNPDCTMIGTTCVSRLCGYETIDSCLLDSNCMWLNAKCYPKACLNITDPVGCKNTPNCVWNGATAPRCQPMTCGYNGAVFCNADPRCFWDPNSSPKCQQNVCPSFDSTNCPAPKCAVRALDGECVRAKCSADNEKSCKTDPDCYWGQEDVVNANGTSSSLFVCSIATGLQRKAAAEEAAAKCSEVEKSYGGLIAGLIILLILLGASLAWIVYRQKQKEKVMGHLGKLGFGGDSSMGGTQLDERPMHDSRFDEPNQRPTNPMEEDLLVGQL